MKSNQNEMNTALTPDLSVVVPVYNEEKNIEAFVKRLHTALAQVDYELIFCLDPSTDQTEEIINTAMSKNPRIGLIVLSRRFGQPPATIAGILNCRGKACVVIDVDLQDPPEVIPQLIDKYKEGYDVVYAKRISRQGETLPKRLISWLGYYIINKISDVNIPRNTGDFRLINRRVIEELRHFGESHGFLRGLVAYVGLNQTFIEYRRDERAQGKGHYNPYTGSIKIGLNGIIGFSTLPLSIIMWSGFLTALLSVLGILYIIIAKLLIGAPYGLGIPTVMVLVLFIGGVQLTCIGLLGEYLGRIYHEVKQRPQYIIDRAHNIEIITPRGT